jgi:hypothetical protein
MNKTSRVILTFLSVIASYCFIFFASLAVPGIINNPAIQIAVSLLAALSIGVFIWKTTLRISQGLIHYIIMGGIIIGSIGFISGFLGPMIFSPSSNLGPLLGIFITGPIGFLIGLVGGGIYWWVKMKKMKN